MKTREEILGKDTMQQIEGINPDPLNEEGDPTLNLDTDRLRDRLLD